MNLNKIYLKVGIFVLTKISIKVKNEILEEERELVKKSLEQYMSSIDTTLMFMNSDLKTYERKLDNNEWSLKG